jgi:hypothetical protein
MPRNWCAFMATRSLLNLRKYEHSLAFICKDLLRNDVSLFHQWDAEESSYGLHCRQEYREDRRSDGFQT